MRNYKMRMINDMHADARIKQTGTPTTCGILSLKAFF